MSILPHLNAALRMRGWIIKRTSPKLGKQVGALLDLLSRDDADGRVYRRTVAHWLSFERPVVERFEGCDCTLAVEGPIYLNDGIGYALSSQLRFDDAWIDLSPAETNLIAGEVRAAIDSVLMRWVAAPTMISRRARDQRVRDRPTEDQIALQQIASATRPAGVLELGRHDK